MEDVTARGTAQFYVLMLCVSVAIFFFALGKNQCPKAQIEYRFLPRTQEEIEELGPARDVLSALT
tara:strand:+ start:4100 stop:4294 length:195 start_codon:yes stop_codon:yes gene_type:complete